MKRFLTTVLIVPALVMACAPATDNRGTIAQLRNRQIEIKEVKIEGGLDKAMASYQRFLQDTPDSALAPEAIRRLADLKVEKEYGLITDGAEAPRTKTEKEPLSAPVPAVPVVASTPKTPAVPAAAKKNESEDDFERRATRSEPLSAAAAEPVQEPLPGGDDLEKAGALEAVELYKKLLAEYPLYERNDQVLYQLSRAYEEMGKIEEAMEVMDRMVREYPHSRYIDEVQFRRAEYFFTRRHYLDAEDAYKSIVEIGVSSSYYQLALYKLGWTFYKQELYEEALHRFIALLDYKVSVGYDFGQTEDEQERKRMEDTFRVISLSFSNLGGANAAVAYFSKYGKRSFEDGVYSNLGEYYYDKRRYSDATATYTAFVERNPFHRKAPNFHMRIIEINMAGGFPSLVIDSKKSFATTYGLKAEYWEHFEPKSRPEVLGFLKTNLTDLANHYHALYQNPKHLEDKPVNFQEALHWYREFLDSFPAEIESPVINYQLADLLLENKSFAEAAVEYEKTAYGYPKHDKSSTAGYAAVYAYRRHLALVPEAKKMPVRREVVRSSLKFADTFPEHEKAAIILGAAVDDLYDMADYQQALINGRKLIANFPTADKTVVRDGWLVVAHSSFKLLQYSDAEVAYIKVLELLPENDKSRPALVDNLAASIYKQGEEANAREDYRAAADHFLRVGVMAPTSTFRATAEFDGAAALIQLQDWKRAASVLTSFRRSFPGHELQPEVTKKIAYVYRQDGLLSEAANEYERIERESKDEDIRREALLTAAELYEKVDNSTKALDVYRRYVGYFPQPVDINLEMRNKVAEILKKREERELYWNELRQIVAIEGAAGTERTPRTRFLAANAALVLAQLSYDKFTEIRLVKPFEVNLRKKQKAMKSAISDFNRLIDYEVGDVTAAATYFLAEIYAHFSKALMESERPDNLAPLELEQYELALEEQAYPFEEKAISVHESNLELLSMGIYNTWIDKSIEKLAVFMPARYARSEEKSELLTSPNILTFVSVEAPPAPVAAIPAETQEVQAPAETQEVQAPAETQEVQAPAETQEVQAPAETQEVQAPAETQEVVSAPAHEGQTSEQTGSATP